MTTEHCTDCAPAHGYQGWTNYETWAVALWIDNDEGSYNHRALARQALEDAAEDHPDYLTPQEHATYLVAETLKAEHEDGNPLGYDASVYTDLLRAALSEVNWHEVAQHYFED